MNPEALAFAVDLLEAIADVINYPHDCAAAQRTLSRHQTTLLQRAAALARAGKGREACRVREAIDGLSVALMRLSSPEFRRPPIEWTTPLERVAGAHAEIGVAEVCTTLTDGHLWAHEASCSLAGLTVDEALAEALRGSLEQWRAALKREKRR